MRQHLHIEHSNFSGRTRTIQVIDQDGKTIDEELGVFESDVDARTHRLMWDNYSVEDLLDSLLDSETIQWDINGAGREERIDGDYRYIVELYECEFERDTADGLVTYTVIFAKGVGDLSHATPAEVLKERLSAVLSLEGTNRNDIDAFRNWADDLGYSSIGKAVADWKENWRAGEAFEAGLIPDWERHAIKHAFEEHRHR